MHPTNIGPAVLHGDLKFLRGNVQNPSAWHLIARRHLFARVQIAGGEPHPQAATLRRIVPDFQIGS
jgi:hypothetical protein